MRAISFDVNGSERAERAQLLLRVLLAPFGLSYLVLYGLAHDLFLLPRMALQFSGRRRSTADFEWSRRLPGAFFNWMAYLLLLTDHRPMRAADVKVVYRFQASRFELIFRPFYLIMLYFNALLFAIPASAAYAIQFAHILALGRRHPQMSRVLDAFCRYAAKIKGYQDLAYDERPPLYPEELRTNREWREDLERLAAP